MLNFASGFAAEWTAQTGPHGGRRGRGLWGGSYKTTRTGFWTTRRERPTQKEGKQLEVVASSARLSTNSLGNQPRETRPTPGLRLRSGTPEEGVRGRPLFFLP